MKIIALFPVRNGITTITRLHESKLLNFISYNVQRSSFHTTSRLSIAATEGKNSYEKQENIPKQDGENQSSAKPTGEQPHPRTDSQSSTFHKKPTKIEKSYMMSHPVYSKEEVYAVKITHKKLETWQDRAAYAAVRTLRFFFDTFTGYRPAPDHKDGDHKTPSKQNMTEEQWLRRIIFLESVAGVPGMVAGMNRHMKSLRTMKRDHGWIHTLLEEAENERMHLLTFMELRQPGRFFRLMVLLGQGVFFNFFFAAYLISPRACHRFVGFLEEEAVMTYTRCLKDLDAGKLSKWTNLAAPKIAINYWQLADDALMRDVLLAVRADEANHRHVNHTFADVKSHQVNPFLEKENEMDPPTEAEQKKHDDRKTKET